jgi:hypothetical protein
LFVEGGIQISRCVGVSSFLARQRTAHFPHTASALAIGLVKAYRKSGEERYVYDDAMKRFLVQKHP